MTYASGVLEIGDGAFTYLQADGSWGLANAGLVVSGGEALLVDTFFDLARTRTMLDAFATASGGARITTLVNTHSHGDHVYGNQLVEGAEIVASRAAAEEIENLNPAAVAAILKDPSSAGAVGMFIDRCFHPFDFEGITVTPPTRRFDGTLTLDAGGTEVRLIEVGPAHSAGDVLVHVPSARVVFAGDILFVGGHPIVWSGPLSNHRRAFERILELDADAIVPGHGPMATIADIRALDEYLADVDAQARERHAAGMSVVQAARDMDMSAYEGWGQPERLAITVASIYRELDGVTGPAPAGEGFALMAELAG